MAGPNIEIPSHQNEEQLLGLRPKATSESSAVIGKTWDEKIKEQSLFSARTTSKAYLDMLKKKLAEIASGTANSVVAETSLKTALQDLGYRPETGFPNNRGKVPSAKPGSITDLSSSRRIGLIIDTNIKQARSLGQIATSEDPAILMTSPAWKLTRTGARKKPRGNWLKRWNEAGNACGWYGASKKEMVALKTSPIWQKLAEGVGGFTDAIGSPFPPFAFGSGMAWVNYDWDDWEDLCEREGIPNHLDEIKEKARKLKSALKGQSESLVPKVDLVPSIKQEPIPTPYRPDLRYRNRAMTIIDDSISGIKKNYDTVSKTQESSKSIRIRVENVLSNDDKREYDYADIVMKMDRYDKVIEKILSDIRDQLHQATMRKEWIDKYSIPKSNYEQGRYNATMDELAHQAQIAYRNSNILVQSSQIRTKAITKYLQSWNII